jgi:NADH dehydrogenase (ubiquinone) 1 alpha subcomplex subunit 2
MSAASSLVSSLRLGSPTFALRELRIHLCQRSAASAGVRDFLAHDYVELKRANPHFPVLVRECSGIPPRVWARYELGRETSQSLENMPRAEVFRIIRELSTDTVGGETAEEKKAISQ